MAGMSLTPALHSSLSAAEKLARQRQAAAIARSHAHLLQLKVMVVCGCAIASAFGVAIYRAGPAASSAVAPPEKSGVYQGAASRRIGQIQVPRDGNNCVNYRFDNKTGMVGDEREVSCTPINIVPQISEISRTDALMKAFRFSK
jgi:hypothetical protein